MDVPCGRRTPVLKCKGCGTSVSAVVIRLKNHAASCRSLKDQGLWSLLGRPTGQGTLRVTRTNNLEKDRVHQALARLIMAENLPFTLLASPFLSAFLDACRPGMKHLTQYGLLAEHLPREYAVLHDALRQRITGKDVTMSIDGWTAPGQQHTLGVAVGSDFLCMETTNAAHTTDFLVAFLDGAIRDANANLGVKVIAIVTDGAANMVWASPIIFCA